MRLSTVLTIAASLALTAAVPATAAVQIAPPAQVAAAADPTCTLPNAKDCKCRDLTIGGSTVSETNCIANGLPMEENYKASVCFDKVRTHTNESFCTYAWDPRTREHAFLTAFAAMIKSQPNYFDVL